MAFPNMFIHPQWLVETGKQLRVLFPEPLPKSSEQHTQFGLMYNELVNIYHSSQQSNSKFTYPLNKLRELADEEENISRKTKRDDGGPSAKPKHYVKDPVRVTSKGASKSKQSCRYCRKSGHNGATCSENPANQGGQRKKSCRERLSEEDDISQSQYPEFEATWS